LRPFDRRNCPWILDPAFSGRFGEEAAAAHLRRHGYRVLVRNYKSKWGEIDLVCRHRETLVFVEVKTRAEGAEVRPARAVDRSKQRRIIRTAIAYVRELPEADMPLRFDIVEVWLEPGQCPRLELHAGAFTLSEPGRRQG
jgi:putative endonuclease